MVSPYIPNGLYINRQFLLGIREILGPALMSLRSLRPEPGNTGALSTEVSTSIY